MKNNPVVNKYAMALFNIAFDGKITEEVLTGIMKIKTALLENPAFLGFILNPETEDKRKNDIIKKILGESDKSGLVLDFFRLVCKKGRVELLTEMADAYHDLVKTAGGEVEVTVYTPFSLTTEQRRSIEKTIKSVKKIQKISVAECIREDLIGGIRMEIMGKIYDGSIAGSLSKIENTLKGE